MRIETRAAIAAGTSIRARNAGGARFSPDQPQPPLTPPAPANGLIGLDAVLALQGEDGGRERRRQAARRGHRLLEGLESLKIALLSGRLSPREIARLSRDIGAGAVPSGDARLDDILAHIELRARVELAKLGLR